MNASSTSETFDQSKLIASLLDPRAYPHSVADFEVVETHISWVILTGPFAYKIKKAVQLDFLDFSTLERRRHFCEEELRLNRERAPELYLDVVPICGSDETPSISGDGEVIEYALKMVQFSQQAQLDNQLNAGLLHEEDMYALAETIAGYHGRARKLDYMNEEDAIGRVRAPMLDNFPPLQQATNMKMLARIQEWSVNSLRELEATLVSRQENGFVRECHGDLHLANLVRLPGGIAAFDCVEFSADLRNIDVLSDLAFLAMDLVSRARQDLAFGLINRYLECTGDYDGMSVFGLYFVYHSMIRGKVSAIRSGERTKKEDREQDIDELKHNLAVAMRWIDRARPTLFAMHGFSGSGKTWLSSQLMSRLPAIRVRSDIERKRKFGLAEQARSDSAPGQGIYSDQATRDIYTHLLGIAESLLGAGYNVIVDASFLSRADREQVATFAEQRAFALLFIETAAGHEELEQRLKTRESKGSDASEADSRILKHQIANADPLDTAEKARTVCVATDTAVDLDDIIKALWRMER